jgi:hypothetical protein
MDEMANIPFPSPDLDPSDFFLFESLKGKMIDQEFDSADDLITSNQATFEAIQNRVLEHVFQEWIWRGQQCIGHEGSYFSE